MYKKSFSISSKNRYHKLIFLYLILTFFFIVIFSFILFTNGTINSFISEYLILFLLPLFIPFLLSIKGLYFFSYDINNGVLNVESNCKAISPFFTSFKKELTIPADYLTKVEFDDEFFGLRKEVIISYTRKNKIYKRKFNISTLSKNELKSFHEYLKNNNH